MNNQIYFSLQKIFMYIHFILYVQSYHVKIEFSEKFRARNKMAYSYNPDKMMPVILLFKTKYSSI